MFGKKLKFSIAIIFYLSVICILNAKLYETKSITGVKKSPQNLKVSLIKSNFPIQWVNKVRREKRAERRANQIDENYDENAEILPDLTYPNEKPLVEQIADSFENIWESLKESVKKCFNLIKSLFSSNSQQFNEY
ncbi:uncharacterized protein LOC119666895 [Teleopsis dalmanni]|uniref:uncharacterized protein LOC119666895 n=1 Tax=Teleopsis dalmanni TaxID=139649 RepID=UPI0018CFE35B|nr:uncharacterized protein LOC119666895 [Teleopsis dalmanni]